MYCNEKFHLCICIFTCVTACVDIHMVSLDLMDCKKKKLLVRTPQLRVPIICPSVQEAIFKVSWLFRAPIERQSGSPTILCGRWPPSYPLGLYWCPRDLPLSCKIFFGTNCYGQGLVLPFYGCCRSRHWHPTLSHKWSWGVYDVLHHMMWPWPAPKSPLNATFCCKVAPNQ